jgi:hypothetical protein
MEIQDWGMSFPACFSNKMFLNYLGLLDILSASFFTLSQTDGFIEEAI